jgi:hypothetical protein
MSLFKLGTCMLNCAHKQVHGQTYREPDLCMILYKQISQARDEVFQSDFHQNMSS